MLFNIGLFKLAAFLSALILPTLFHKEEWIGETVDWPTKIQTKAKLLIHIFVRAILSMKRLQIEKTKSFFIISVLKVEY